MLRLLLPCWLTRLTTVIASSASSPVSSETEREVRATAERQQLRPAAEMGAVPDLLRKAKQNRSVSASGLKVGAQFRQISGC